MNPLLIFNSTAGQHRPDSQAEQMRKVLDRLHCPTVYTHKAGDAQEIAFDAVLTKMYDTLVVVGGDGTINEVVNGIMRAGPMSDPPAIGIVPTGTCNILATELGLPLNNPDAAVEIIKSGLIRRIDIGRAGGRYFTMMASFGFDAEAIKRLQPAIKELVGASAYVLSGLAALADSKPSRVHLTLDEVVLESEAFLVVVANTSAYAYETLKVAPFAAIDDGWLDICIFERPPGDKIGFIGQLLLTMARRHLGDPRIRYYRARNVQIVAEPPMLGQLDGDLAESTPITIEIVPRELRVLTP